MFIAELYVKRRLKSKKSEIDEQPVTPTSTAVPKTTISTSPTKSPMPATPVPRIDPALDTGRTGKGNYGIPTSVARG